MKQLWNELMHLKEISAVVTLFFGFGLTIASFIIEPTGVVDDSVLWILGQVFLYIGAVFSISTHYQSKQEELEEKINSRLDKKHDD